MLKLKFVKVASALALSLALVAGTSVASSPAEAAVPCNSTGNSVYDTQATGIPTCGHWWYVQFYWARQLGGYTGDVNGIMGPNSWKGVQRYLNVFGASLIVDGAPGPNTYRAIQRHLNATAGAGLVVDGVMGPRTYKAWAADLISASG